ncbi:MAG: ABC transporter permease, partial [Candidatus Zixiibacteriota bacterium]
AGYAALKAKLDTALETNKIKSYAVLFDGIVENDSCIVVAKSFSFRTADRFDWAITRTLTEERLTGTEINIGIDSVLSLTHRTEFTQMAPGEKQRNFEIIYLAGIVFVMVIFGTVVGYGQILMRSVIEEKNSRIIEVMVSSVSSFQLMAGKIIGLGMASLTQVAIWMVIGVGIYNFRGSMSISADISDVLFNPVLIFFFVIYLILGYLLFSTLFALIGSIVNSEKEAQGFIFPITMTVMLPIILSMYIVQEPESTLAVVLSLIPFLTPTMMLVRLNIISPTGFSLANPVVMQSFIGMIITILTILAVIWVTAKIFRVGILMYGKRPTLPEIVKWIKY